MKHRLIFHPRFFEDIATAQSWIEHARTGWGSRFAAAVEMAVSAIIDYPESFKIVAGDYRRALLRKFGYLVVFSCRGEQIRLIGVMHGARDITSWLESRDL